MENNNSNKDNNSIIITNNIEVYWNKSNNKCVNEFEITDYISRGLMWSVFKVNRYHKNEKDELCKEIYALKRGHIRSLKNMRYYEDDEKRDYFDRVWKEIKIHEVLNKYENFPILHEVLYDKSSEIEYNLNNQYIYIIIQYCDLGQLMYAIENDDYKYYHNYDVLSLIANLYLQEYKYLFENDLNKERVISSSSDKCFDEENIPDEVHYFYNDKNKLYLENFNFIKACAKILFIDIAKGLQNMHKCNIYYNDIKPDNICLKSNKSDDVYKSFSVMLLDFSISEISETNILKSVTGTLRFQAPESFMSGFKGSSSDIWSFGILLYLFLTGEFPFDGESELEIQIKTDKCEFKIPNHLDMDCKNLITNILKRDPDERLSIESILKELIKW